MFYYKMKVNVYYLSRQTLNKLTTEILKFCVNYIPRPLVGIHTQRKTFIDKQLLLRLTETLLCLHERSFVYCLCN